jgi:hypothetical protein
LPLMVLRNSGREVKGCQNSDSLIVIQLKRNIGILSIQVEYPYGNNLKAGAGHDVIDGYSEMRLGQTKLTLALFFPP